MNITLVGGGSITHTLIPILSSSGHKVSLLTNRCESWNEEVFTEYKSPTGVILKKWVGQLQCVSDSPSDVITNADVVIISLPVHMYYSTLERIIPFIPKDRKVFLGSIYGQGGFNWMVKSIIENKYPKLNYFTFGLVPWVCRTKIYGSAGETYGPKKVNTVAMRFSEDFEYLKSIFFSSLTGNTAGMNFRLVSNFLSLTLSADNQLIHITRLYCLMRDGLGKWRTEDEVPLFYRDYDEYSADCLNELDKEFSKVRGAIEKYHPELDYSYMLDYLAQEKLSYGVDTPSILDSFVNSKTLGTIKTPVVFDGEFFKIDIEHRFFKDDIFNGIVIFKWFASELGISTPLLDNVLNWAQDLLGILIIEKGQLVDSKYLKTPQYYEIGLADSVLN